MIISPCLFENINVNSSELLNLAPVMLNLGRALNLTLPGVPIN